MNEPSDHFNGRRFYNRDVSPRSFWDLLRWLWMRKIRPWSYVAIEQQKIQQERTKKGECVVTFINHSSLLIQLEGWNILTDPIWSERASPFSWMGPKRTILPGVKFEDLPPIDVVLLSHNHYDHMDIPTICSLAKKYQPVFYVPKGNQAYLKSKGITGDINELDWWDWVDFCRDYRLYFVPSQHFSARGLFDRNATLWGGFVIKGSMGMIYFAGDTGMGAHFAEIQRRLGSPTLSFLPIGAFEPRWFMQPMHLSPDEAVEAHVILGSKQSLAIHFGTFQLSDEERDAPVEELQKSLKERGLPLESFWVLKPGESREMKENP